MRKPLQGLGAKQVDELLIVDASIYMHKAYYASKGAPLGVLRGFAEVLAEMLDTRPPTYAACAFDSGLPSFRVDILPTYKAHRGPHPEGFDEQVPLCMAVARALGFAVLVRDRVEGDDLVGGAVRLAVRAGVDATILSIDKDLAQLVQDEGPRVSMLTRPGGEVRDESAVRAKYGVKPSQITDWIGIAGDAVDGIPGVQGIGVKLAARLLTAHGTIEGIKAADGVQLLSKTTPSKKALAFERDIDKALLCRELAILRCGDLLLDDVEALRRIDPNRRLLLELCDEVGLDDWALSIKARPASAARAILAARRGYATVPKEKVTMASTVTSIDQRLAERRARQQKAKGASSPPPLPERDAGDVLDEILDVAPDDFDIDELDLKNVAELERVLAEFKGEGAPAPKPVDTSDRDAVIARIIELNPKRERSSCKDLSLKLLNGVLRTLESRAAGATGATGVNPPTGGKTEPAPSESKKTRGRKRTPPLPDKFGGKAVSRASVTELKTYVFAELGLEGAKASRTVLRGIVEASLRGEELPEHNLATTPSDDDAAPEDDAPNEPGDVLVPMKDGPAVPIADATDAHLARVVNERSGDVAINHNDYAREDLEFITLEVLAGQVVGLEKSNAILRKQLDSGSPATHKVSNLTKASLADAVLAAAEAFAASIRG